MSRNFEKEILQILAKRDLTLLEIEAELCKTGFVTHGHVRQKLTEMKHAGAIEWKKQGRFRSGSKVLWSLPKPKQEPPPTTLEKIQRNEPSLWLMWGGYAI